MKNKATAYSRFMALSDEEKSRTVARYDRKGIAAESRPLTTADKQLWRKAKAKMGRPKVGQGVRVIALSVEKGLLRRADARAKAEGVSRARLVARGLELLLAS